ncbi:MAG: PEP-CTERM sorting domain-containing protein [Verrucomicrobiae bacterium]|nr:PEP-CTERM sorting domain-containing protein [Verrucomicrobiae bacterium]
MKNSALSRPRKSLTAAEKAASLQEFTSSGLRAQSFGVTTPALGAVAAGGVALCAISDVDGAIVIANSVPGFVSNAATAQWDIDGDAVIDFTFNGGSQYATDPVNGNQIAATTFSVARAFASNTTAYDVAAVIAASGFSYVNFGPNFGATPKNFAFQFKISGQTHYGWGTMTTGSLNISQAYYNDTPLGAINVGQVPEPSTAGLLALTMGAVGMRRFRKQKRSTK